MRLLLSLGALCVILVMPGQASAEWVDSYGGATLGGGSFIPPGQYGWRDPDGTLHYPPPAVRTPTTWTTPTPTLPVPAHAPHQTDRYEMLTDTTPGSSYRSDSLFHDRVPRRTPQP